MNGTDPIADRVLILGGGMAGVACAQKLGDEGIDVVLVDRNDYHQFQPLLYQVASSQLPADDIARPHRTIFADYPSVTLVNAQVSEVKLSQRSVPGAAEHTFPLYSDADADYALRKLTEVGADVKLEVGVTAVHPDRVEFDDETTIPARTVVWGGGESASAVAQTLGPVLGRGGRLNVRPDLTVEGYPGVYAVGDVANIPSRDEDAPTLPQLGSVAQQSGRWAAENILRERGHRSTKPFKYKDKGIMAMIGRNAAIAEVGKHRHQVEGPLAFAAWLGVHAMLLSGTHSKTDAFLTWAWDYFDRDHAATVEASSVPQRIAWGRDDEHVPHISLDRPKPAHTPHPT